MSAVAGRDARVSGFDTTSARRAPAQPFRPPGPSVARRDIVLRQPVSGKGALVTSGPEPRCEPMFDAGEEKLALMMMTHFVVTVIEGQCELVRYSRWDGRRSKHRLIKKATLRSVPSQVFGGSRTGERGSAK